jgi:hypothetical protein
MIIRTLQEHIDDLDRMVDSGTGVPKVRSQIAFIAREVACLEAAYAQLADAHTKLERRHETLKNAMAEPPRLDSFASGEIKGSVDLSTD